MFKKKEIPRSRQLSIMIHYLRLNFVPSVKTLKLIFPMEHYRPSENLKCVMIFHTVHLMWSFIALPYASY